MNSEGILPLPAISLPRPIGEQWLPTSPPSPPELPPQVRVSFQGFLAYPKILLLVYRVLLAWGVLDLTKGINPIFLMIMMSSEGYSGIGLIGSTCPIYDIFPG